MIELLNIDCMEYMAGLLDKTFDLAIVDPPYNVGASDGNFGGKLKAPSRISGKLNGKNYANHDKTPDEHYFKELFRVSKNQIIWGSNYYPEFLYHSGAIFWDKKNDNNHVLSDGEIAFQSFNKQVKIFRSGWAGFYKEDLSRQLSYRVHPNQKPVNLYRYCLHNYAKEGDKILDTHLGSGSSAIAAHQMGFDFVGTEIDADYYAATLKRYNNAIKQQTMFPPG